MYKTFKFFISCGLILSNVMVFAQEESQENSDAINYGHITVGLGYGVNTFIGDIGVDQDLATFSNFRGAFSLYAEKRVLPFLGVDLTFMSGKVSQNEIGATASRNFESKLTSVGAGIKFLFDNEWMIPPEEACAPYLGAGVGYLMFDPHGDQLDENGNPYYYWNDGSIRNMEQNEANEDVAQIVYRDYVYETQLTDSATSYSRGGLVFPISVGLNFRLGNSVQARAGVDYNITMTDFLDNISGGDKNDAFLYSNITVAYTFGAAGENSRKAVMEREKHYDDVDFLALFREDEDNDGVEDVKDECHGTPAKIPVDEKGCPFDEDDDGVPDYMDREKNTPKNSVVDHNGIALTDAMLEKLRIMRDSIWSERVEHFYEAANVQTLQKIDQEIQQHYKQNNILATGLPKQYHFADLNSNGIIESSEITAAIDSFFEGEIDITVEALYALIDYFFEQ